MQQLTYDKEGFRLGGKPFRILSGAIHYFRIPREYWYDRLLKLKAMGLNTVETYLAWNYHEERENVYDFAEERDFGHFLDLAHQLGLYAIVRPGPYICAEWEFGGLPAWLLREGDMVLRAYDQRFLCHVDRYFDAISPILLPRLAENGGNIIGVQVENEYGSYGADKRYLTHLRDGLLARGYCGCLFTSDGPGHTMLGGGSLPGVLQTANFGSGAAQRFPVLREHQPDAPVMCCEFWDGWFDHWGSERHQTREPQQTAAELEAILAEDGSVNLYMFCGGSNFGFMNGANSHLEHYLPTTTSYDYDAPLNEAGQITPKYHAFRAVLEKWAGPLPALELPEAVPVQAFGRVRLLECAPLLQQLTALARPIHSPFLLSMEQVGQNVGFILYRATVRGPIDEDAALQIKGVRDRVQVFINAEHRGTFYRDDEQPACVPFTLGFGETAVIELLVENMGRTNYGARLGENRKGIVEGVFLEYQYISDWEIFTLPLDRAQLAALDYQPRPDADTGPAFYRGRFQVEQPADSYLRTDGLEKGVAFVNGINLGRYWNRGPQRALYIPAPFLRRGENLLELFELHTAPPEVELVAQPCFDL